MRLRSGVSGPRLGLTVSALTAGAGVLAAALVTPPPRVGAAPRRATRQLAPQLLTAPMTLPAAVPRPARAPHRRPRAATTLAQPPSPAAAAVDFRLPAAAVFPQPCPPPPRPAGPPGSGRPPVPAVPDARLPAAPAPPSTARPSTAALAGSGVWLVDFPGSVVDVGQLLAAAGRAHARSVWVRVGSSHDGFYAGPLLDALLPAAHARGIAVLGWDFPTLSDPVADARRVITAGRYRTPAGDRLDGVSPDVETAAEGVFDSARRAALFFGELRAGLPGLLTVATVPRVFGDRLLTYPYAAVARYADALAPMIYWSCTEPGAAVATTVTGLRGFGLPLHLVGQGYDMGPEGGRPGNPTAAEEWRFADAAHAAGALGVSLYTYPYVTGPELDALGRYPW